MNPIDTEEDIRRLELMLYGGRPLRPSADFGRDELRHFDVVESRAGEVCGIPGGSRARPEIVVERYFISENGSMRVAGPGRT